MVERILKKLGKTEFDGSNPRRQKTGALLMLTSCSRAPVETGSVAGEEEDAKLRKAKRESLSISTWFGEEMKNVVKELCVFVSRLVANRNRYPMCTSAQREREWKKQKEWHYLAPFQQSESSDMNYLGFFKNRRHEFSLCYVCCMAGPPWIQCIVLWASWEMDSWLPGSVHGAKWFAYLKAQKFLTSLPAFFIHTFWEGQEDPLEKETATHSSIFAWEIP